MPPAELGRDGRLWNRGRPLERLGTRGTSNHSVDIKPMIPLGQFRDTFIIAIDDEGVAIIDQHVAHERVLFERVMERLTRRPPRVAAAAHAARHRRAGVRASVARRPRAELERFGFEIEGFGASDDQGRRRCRRCSTSHDSAKALLALARRPRRPRSRRRACRTPLQRIAATTACHAAVKANYPLTYEKMTHILEELRATAYSTVCPHGRPVMLRLTRREIEKNFERI